MITPQVLIDDISLRRNSYNTISVSGHAKDEIALCTWHCVVQQLVSPRREPLPSPPQLLLIVGYAKVATAFNPPKHGYRTTDATCMAGRREAQVSVRWLTYVEITTTPLYHKLARLDATFRGPPSYLMTLRLQAARYASWPGDQWLTAHQIGWLLRRRASQGWVCGIKDTHEELTDVLRVLFRLQCFCCAPKQVGPRPP